MKLRRLTKECVVGACPAIFQDENGGIIVVGKTISVRDAGLSDSVSTNESIVYIDTELITEAVTTLRK